MKKVSSVFITTYLLLSVSLCAQTKPVPVEKMQVLLKKAVGQHYISTWLRDDELITQQAIAGDSFALRYTVVRYDRKMANEFTHIPWANGFTYVSDTATGNPDLVRFTLKFEKELFLTMHYGTAILSSNYTKTRLVFFVREKDVDEMTRLLN